MKKLVYILFLNLFCLTGYSQYNLQFNQVVTLNGVGIGCQNTSVGSVPTGKVWKLEAWTNSNEVAIYFNGTIYNNHYLAGWGNSNGQQFQLSSNLNPIWLKAGDNISVTISNQFCQNRSYFFSIIEFNLVP
jgi:hypothetical protein